MPVVWKPFLPQVVGMIWNVFVNICDTWPRYVGMLAVMDLASRKQAPLHGQEVAGAGCVQSTFPTAADLE